MKVFKILSMVVLFFHLSLACAEGDFSDYWSLAKDNKQNQVWRAKSNSKIMASSYVKKASPYANSKLLFDDSFLEKLKDKKRKMLGMFGITEWQLKGHKWLTKGKAPVLRVEGSYKDGKGVVTKFVEIHRYSKLETIQLLYTWPQSIGALDEKLSNYFFDRYMVK